jgi:hypothetical protein
VFRPQPVFRRLGERPRSSTAAPGRERTRAIERNWHRSRLGERFLCYTVETDPEEQVDRAVDNDGKEEQMRQELSDAVGGVLAGLSSVVPTVDYGIKSDTKKLSLLLAKLRCFVERDRNGVAHTAPEVEVPTRLVKQLLTLGRALAMVRGEPEVTDDEFEVMRKVAIDSIPSARLETFKRLLSFDNLTATDVADRCNFSLSVARRHLDDLVLLGLAWTDSKEKEKRYSIVYEVREQWKSLS